MILKLQDKTEIVINEEEAEAVTKALDEGNEFIKIGKETIRRTSINGLYEGGITQADFPDFGRPQLPEAKKCHGQYSIQAEIHRIAMDEGKDGSWVKLVQDKAWREETRQKLRKQTDKWCDYKENNCACEDLQTAPI